MTTQVRVSIATTSGAIAIERIAPLGLRKSRVFTWRGLAPLPAISASYDEFVRKRVTRILPSGDTGPFRIDLSQEIDTGDSWQLAVLAAHALHRAERLAGRESDDADTWLFATGTVDFEMAAGEVGYVEDKLRLLLRDERLNAVVASGKRVVVAMPEANAADARAEQEQLRRLGAEVLAVRQVEDLLRTLDLNIKPSGADPDDAWEGSPFRGLEVFDVRHRKIFWGRGKAREEALQVLRRQDLYGCSFLLIHGSSGVGKSSLARAGLLGDLEQMASANDRWRSAVVVPSRGMRTPIAALAEALASAVPELAAQPAELAARLLANPAEATVAIAAALASAEAGGRLRVALLVDQLEELLLWTREQQTGQAAGEREAFAETLSRLARSRLVWVVATLRSDLMALLEDSPVLSDLARNERLYRLERPRPGALAEIIRRPAELAGLSFVGHDKDNLPLVDVLTDAAKRQQDCLPLLQFTLKLLYDDKERRPGTISYQQYESAGGLENAIGTWADRTIGALGADPETERAVDDVIFNLARRGRETEIVVGAELLLDEGFLTPARERVIQALDQARLIVLDASPQTQRRTARVAHEALLNHWRRARSLFETHSAKLLLKDDLEHDALRWREQEKDDDFLILSATHLVDAEQLMADSRVALSARARDYIKESLAHHRSLVESVKARLARDEQKIASLIGDSAYGEAAIELDRVVDYLADQMDADLRDRLAQNAAQQTRLRTLAAYDSHARTVFPKAGQEDFEQARLACEGALAALDVLGDSQGWGRLPVQDLSAEQADELRREIYRLLLLNSGLQLVPVIRNLRSLRTGGGRRPVPAWLVRLLFRLAPRSLITSHLQRIADSLQITQPAENKELVLAFERCRAALRAVRRVEEAIGGPDSERSRTSLLVERIVEMFSSLLPGARIDVATVLAFTAPARFAEPINAADYFYIALFNYFVAKRRNDGSFAAAISLLQGNFPQLDAKAPLTTAERLLRMAIALESRNFWPHWVLGRTLQEAGNHAAAELAFNTAIALEPHYARGYEQRALSLARQWTATRDDRLRERARADSRLAGRYAAGDPSIYWPRGELFDELGETREALDAYCLWLELEEDVLATVARGAGVTRLFRRATDMLGSRQAEALQADTQALLALLHWTWKDHAAALQAADAALAIAPAHVHALGAKGAALRATGKFREALADGLEPARAADPRNFWVLLNRAQALQDLGADDAAEAAWRELLARAGEKTHDHCPTWIRERAKAGLVRVPAEHRAQPQAA
ncbi:hypothetical protein [Reyranella sp.]|uniref:tetratricopeptide repeat protein n=1 Tax=Reyranella sp. TaxID=1929291 RepID=UPI0037851232